MFLESRLDMIFEMIFLIFSIGLVWISSAYRGSPSGFPLPPDGLVRMMVAIYVKTTYVYVYTYVGNTLDISLVHMFTH